jgi:hypothetical protein
MDDLMLTTVGTTAFTTGAKPVRLGAAFPSVNLKVAGGFAVVPEFAPFWA